MNTINVLEVTATILAAALGKSEKTAQLHLVEIRKKANKSVAFQFVTVDNIAEFYGLLLVEAYLWLKMKTLRQIREEEEKEEEEKNKLGKF